MNLWQKLFKSREKIVVVSGLPRSGTSMMMKMLEAGGLPPLTDKIRVADGDNPQGYYEFERVKQLDKGDIAWLPEASGKAVKVISQLLKHLPATYQYQLIFMRRHMAEILASQNKMLQNRGEAVSAADDAMMKQLFEAHLAQIEGWLAQQSHFSVLSVHYSDMLQQPQQQAARVNQFLAGKLEVARMTAVVDPTLYRNRTI